MAEFTIISPEFPIQQTLEMNISSSRSELNFIYNSLIYTSSIIQLTDLDYSEKQQKIISLRAALTASLEKLSNLYDEKNKINPEPGFPLAGEKIIRVGETFDIIWNNTIVPSINIFFMKGGTKIPVTVLKEETDNKKSFVIDITHFSDEYLPCKIRIESTDVNTVFDDSVVFKILRSN